MEPTHSHSQLKVMKAAWDALVGTVENGHQELDLRKTLLDTRETECAEIKAREERLVERESELDAREVRLDMREQWFTSGDMGKDLATLEQQLEARKEALKQREQALKVRETKVRDEETGLELFQQDLHRQARFIEGFFPYFRKLSPEIRGIIWSFAIVDTPYSRFRIHSIRAFCGSSLRSAKSPNSTTYKTIILNPSVNGSRAHTEKGASISQYGTHPIMHACRESRNFVLHKLNITFAFSTYINWDLDILLMDKCAMVFSDETDDNAGFMACDEFARCPDLKGKIKRLALHSRGSAGWVASLGHRLEDHLENLEELFFVTKDTRYQNLQYPSTKHGHYLFFPKKKLSAYQNEWKKANSSRPEFKYVGVKSAKSGHT